MPKFEMEIPHKLNREEALRRAKSILDGVKKEFADKIHDLSELWNADTGKFSFSVWGFSFSGTLIVKQNKIEISGKIPWAAIFKKGEIEATIRERAQTLLA
jgi:hypothetical protein